MTIENGGCTPSGAFENQQVNLKLSAVSEHLPSKLNVQADWESQNSRNPSD